MNEKYIFGLIGITLGSVLSAIFGVARELYTERRSKRKEAEYLAIRMVCIFEAFIEGCAAVVGDDGLLQGQPDADGYSRIQVSAPQLDIKIDDVNWKSLPPELMYEILYFPSLIKDAENYIDSVFEYNAFPPDFWEGFEERQYQYSKLGLKASELTTKLRKKYKIPKKNISNWNIVEYMNSEISKIEEMRSRRAEEHKKMLTVNS